MGELSVGDPEVERTEADEDDHPDTDVDLATTVPVLEDRSGGINVVGGDDQILQKVIISKGESDGRVHETGGITGEASFVWNVGRHFAERNHDEVANKPDKAVAKQETEGTTSAGVGSEWM